jgi:prephenate dehydrogenase
MKFDLLTAGIIGLGQMGGSIAQRLTGSKTARRVIGFDINVELLNEAKAKRIIDRACLSMDELIAQADLIIIALPIEGILSTITQYASALKDKIAVTDTGSLKSPVMVAATKAGLRNFVGGHPLAGTEKRGSASWDMQVFEEANYFITIRPEDQMEAKEAVVALISALGARPIEVDPVEHDDIFATTSNLPHLFAYCLKRQHSTRIDGQVDKDMLSCPSFRGATRIAASDPEMVFQMLWFNRQHLIVSLEQMLEAFAAAKKALDSEDKKGFRHFFGLP